MDNENKKFLLEGFKLGVEAASDPDVIQMFSTGCKWIRSSIHRRGKEFKHAKGCGCGNQMIDGKEVYVHVDKEYEAYVKANPPLRAFCYEAWDEYGRPATVAEAEKRSAEASD